MTQRWSFVGMVVKDRHESALRIQDLLTTYGDVVLGRLGVPLPEAGISAIGLILNGEQERTALLTEKLRELDGVYVSTSSVIVE
ncbi:MAG: CopG family transcriptional regulator [Firmicutes bacterium]|nr:CopG family transcriptional regulator [Bacillota bacterium]